MADFYKGITDHRGRPIEKKRLTETVAAASFGGVRSPLSDYPGDGLTPPILSAILKEADQGYPRRFYEIAETIEERDLHYAAVLGVRKRSVSQLEIVIEDGSDDPAHISQAEMVREWLKRDELSGDLFDMLDAIGKGESFTEIGWDTSEGQWWPKMLDWRDPRWFRPSLHDLTTPMLIDDNGQTIDLPAGKFVHLVMRGKSGLPARSGLARLASWFWLFKAMTTRDWAIYTATYGQPLRVGKYGPNASEDDKETLFQAVANIAGDCAAIIPESMLIEFIQPPAGSSGSSALYKDRADWLDQQMSKATLGQTTTTDAISGGHAVSQEHRLVQEDIERADANVLGAALTRDLVIPWVQLEFGPQTAYPRMKIGRREDKDVDQIVRTVTGLGLPMKKSEAYELAGISAPQAGDEVILPRASVSPTVEPTAKPGDQPAETLHAERPDPALAGSHREQAKVDALAADTGAMAGLEMDRIFDEIGALVSRSSSLEELRATLLEMAPGISTKALARALRQAQVVARLSGRADLTNG